MTRHSPRAKRPVCKLCRGKKQVVRTRKFGMLGFTDRETITCPECGGTGKPKETT